MRNRNTSTSTAVVLTACLISIVLMAAAPAMSTPPAMNKLAPIVIVALDTKSYDELKYDATEISLHPGGMPIDNRSFALLLNSVKSNGGRLLAFDYTFFPTPPLTLSEKDFADSIRTSPIPVIFGYDTMPRRPATDYSFSLARFALTGIRASSTTAHSASYLQYPISEYISGSAVPACITLTADRDGLVSRVPLFIKHNGMILPSMPLSIALKAAGVPASQVKLAGSGKNRRLIIRNTSIKLNPEDDSMTVNLPRQQALFKRIPLWDVIGTRDRYTKQAREKRLKMLSNAFRGSIVIFGITEPMFRDTYRTPAGALYPESEIIAAAANQILSAMYGSRQPADASQ